MNKVNKQNYNNIKYGNNVDKAIPEYLESLSGLYKKFSELNLAMHYFMFYENYIDSYHAMDIEDLNVLAGLNKLIKRSYFPKNSKDEQSESLIDNDQLIQELNLIRNDIISRMKILTNYTDILLIYDYILKRMEFRFVDNLEEIDDELVTDQIVDYIFDTEDQVIINNKLSDVISQLPVRMSRFKYFDLVGESFSIFEDKSPLSLESYLYMFRSSAMLYKLEGMEEKFPEINFIKEELETTNYNDLLQEDWINLTTKLDETTKKINYLADHYYGLQEIVNQLYIYLLNSNQPSKKESIDDPIQAIIKHINNNFINNSLELTDETVSLLNQTEGVQEELLEDISSIESVFPLIEEKYKDILVDQGLEYLYDNLKQTQQFFTNSLFFEINKIEDTKTLSKAEVNMEKISLQGEIEELFKKNSRYVNRAVMANTLNKIPGFLISQDEVGQYIHSSLIQCQDSSEKKASINIIRSFWE